MTACIHGNVCRAYYRRWGRILSVDCPGKCHHYAPTSEPSDSKARLARVSRVADRLHDEARALSELSGDGCIPRNVSVAIALKFGISDELKEVLR